MARAWHIPLILLVIAISMTSLVQEQNRYQSMRVYRDVSKTTGYMPLALRFAVKEYNQASDEKYIYKVIQVIQAQEKITSNICYLMTIKLGRTTCKKTEIEHVHCPIEENPDWRKNIICSFEVFALPWLYQYNLMNWNCTGT